MIEALKSNKMFMILILVILMATVVASRSSGECGQSCVGTCPVDAQSIDSTEVDFTGEDASSVMGGTNNLVIDLE